MLEIIGYIASVLVAVSLMMSSILRLRLVNLAGSGVFAVYGYLIGATPVFLVNAFIAIVNIYYLTRLFTAKELFRILEVKPDSDYLRYFLDLNRAEIARYTPGFDGTVRRGDIILYVLRDLVPAGLFIGQPHGDGSMSVKLDYVLPNYRDFKVGSFLFRERAAFFRERGIYRLIAEGGTRRHAGYLRRMGFVPASERADLYVHWLDR